VSVWDRRANEIFLEAVERPESERTDYLNAACNGDSGLRTQVEGLLAAASKSRDFIERPMVQRPTEPPSARLIDDSPFAVKYRLQEKIGSGGMGVVYAAMQTTPIVRKVAVKLIRSDSDGPAQLARFEQERQALALMNHPNIAKVFDAGATDDGQPYLVMEFIPGVPLGEYCDRARLPVAARLELFADVCRGLHHAHQKGVIHRDLKPSNMLVSEVEGKPTPKLIDFGVAKAIGSRLIERTIQTIQSTLVGTLEYMAPEQAGLSSGGGNDVDTRCDVYSMGVILYELLTGVRPFDRERLKKASLDEAVRIVRDEEPPSLVQRLADPSTLSEAATNRGTDPKSLLAAMSGDLNWIVFRCLAKDRERRYASANDLADDVRRYLANEPIEARPPSSIYRLQKLVQRRRGTAIAASLVALSLVGGTIGTTIGFLRANRARKSEAAERANAEAARDQAWDALDAMTSAVTGDSLASQPEVASEQKVFLRTALDSYQTLASGKADDEPSRSRIAKAALRVGRIEYILGAPERAVDALRAAAANFKSLADDHPDRLEYRGLQVEALADASACCRRLGRTSDEQALLNLGETVAQELVAKAPRIPLYRKLLADVVLHMASRHDVGGRWKESSDCYQRAQVLVDRLVKEESHVEQHAVNLAIVHAALGIDAWRRKDLPNAERGLRRSIELRQALSPEHSRNSTLRADLASNYHRLGTFLWLAGRAQEGIGWLRQSMKLSEELVERYPSRPDFRRRAAETLNDLAEAVGQQGDHAEEQRLKELNIKAWERLIAEFAGGASDHINLGGAYCNLGLCHRRRSQLNEALVSFDKAVELLERRRAAGDSSFRLKQYLANSLNCRALAREAASRWLEAADDHRKGLEFTVADKQADGRLSIAYCLVKGGKPADAKTEVARLPKSDSLSVLARVKLAQINALLSASGAPKSQNGDVQVDR
jgi:eukaryotic-like serine/threonine-protein kinase